MPQGFCADCSGGDGDNDRGGLPESDEKLGRGRMKDNPIDTCSGRFMACHNPCGHGPGNKASCETLPSQIENFTLQFFGDVIKTEVDGQVMWSLPCSLTIGLPNNPRGATEPLACYFLRLFNTGVTGITGPQGAPGTTGQNGHNAYTIVTHSFTQPSLSNPQIQIRTEFNPAFLAGLDIFIDQSGWYNIYQTNPDGTLFLTMLAPLAGAPAVIPTNSLVITAGAPGIGIAGPAGDKGQKGDPGDTGSQGPQGLPSPTSGVTNNNGEYHDGAGTNYSQNVNSWNDVLFVSSNPTVTLPTVGRYLFVAVTGMEPGMNGVPFLARLFNNTTSSALVQCQVTLVANAMVTMIALVDTLSINNVIKLQAFGNGTVFPVYTTITWVQIA